MSFCLLLLSFCHMIKNQLRPRLSYYIRVCACMCGNSASINGACVLGRYWFFMVSGTMGIVSALYGSVCGCYDVQGFRYRVAAGYSRHDRLPAPVPQAVPVGHTGRGRLPCLTPFPPLKTKSSLKSTVCLMLTYISRHIIEKIAAKNKKRLDNGTNLCYNAN